MARVKVGSGLGGFVALMWLGASRGRRRFEFDFHKFFFRLFQMLASLITHTCNISESCELLRSGDS
jgi:hypothetical protein